MQFSLKEKKISRRFILYHLKNKLIKYCSGIILAFLTLFDYKFPS